MKTADRLISDRPQLRTLANATRQELLDLLVRSGPASAAALARWTGRPADGLYYHLRELERVGLIQEDGQEAGPGRKGVRYRAAHREPAIRHETGPRGNSRDVSAIVGSMLRLGVRDFRRAAAIPGVRTSEPGRELWAMRVTGRLTPADLRQVNRRMRGLRDSVGRAGAKGDLYAITILLTPLGRQRKSRKTKP